MCTNKVGQTVSDGAYDYKVVYLRCGQTSVTGDPLECGKCKTRRIQVGAPRPGYCKHGTFINTDHDIPCYRCEIEAS